MEPVLLIAAVAFAGLACPAMMWWNRRRDQLARESALRAREADARRDTHVR